MYHDFPFFCSFFLLPVIALFISPCIFCIFLFFLFCWAWLVGVEVVSMEFLWRDRVVCLFLGFVHNWMEIRNCLFLKNHLFVCSMAFCVSKLSLSREFLWTVPVTLGQVGLWRSISVYINLHRYLLQKVPNMQTPKTRFFSYSRFCDTITFFFPWIAILFKAVMMLI